MMNFFRTYPKLLLPLFLCVFLLAPAVTYAGLTTIIMSIVAFFLWIAAALFDEAVNLFVLQMGGLITGETGGVAGIGASIDMVWTIVRDLVNITFIFGLVYVGFRTILDADANTKKLLSSIIIGALLVNFSLFISKVVIDVSNITAIEIYQQMDIGNQNVAPGQPTDTVSARFLAHMGLTKLVSPKIEEEWIGTVAGEKSGDTDTWIAFVVGSSIFILVAAFVFAAGALLLAIRFGVLVILMILSPIAFAAAVLPGIGGWSRKWWETLFKQAFFAPAYLFMLYLTLIIAEGYRSEGNRFDLIFTNTQGQYQVGFQTAAFFVLTIVMMVAALIVSKQMGAYGASKALSTGKKLRGYATSYVGRNTIGRGAEWLGKKNEQLEGTRTGRNFKRFISTASLGTLTERTRQNLTEAGKKANFGGSYSRADDQSWAKKQKATRANAERAMRRNAVLKSIQNKDGRYSSDDLAKEIKKMNTAEIESMGTDTIKKYAQYLTNKQVSQLMESKNDSAFNETEKAEIKDMRSKLLFDLFKADTKKFFDGMKDIDVAQLPDQILKDVRSVPHVTPNALDKMLDEQPGNVRIEIRPHYENLPANDHRKRWLDTPAGLRF